MAHKEMCGKVVKMMSEIEPVRVKGAMSLRNGMWHGLWKYIIMRNFSFYLMVLFVPAANKGKVTHGKTPRVFYIFSGLLHHSGSSWSDVKDL